MEFGRRTQPTPNSTAVSGAPKRAPLRLLLTIAIALIAAGAAFYGFAHRQQLAANYTPQLLRYLKPADHQLAGRWHPANEITLYDEMATLHILDHIVRACGTPQDHEWFAKVQRQYQKVYRQVDPSVREAVGTFNNVYGPQKTTVAAQIAHFDTNPTYCASSYPIDLHDARVATIEYSSRNQFLADIAQFEVDLLITWLKAGTTHANDPKSLAAHYCANTHSPDLNATVDCFLNNQIDRHEIDRKTAPLYKQALQLYALLHPTTDNQISAPTATPSYDSPTPDIRAYCARVHTDNYQFREICENNQIEAQQQIAGMNVPDEVARYCDRVHPDSYQFRKICYDNQIAAKQRNGY